MVNGTVHCWFFANCDGDAANIYRSYRKEKDKKFVSPLYKSIVQCRILMKLKNLFPIFNWPFYRRKNILKQIKISVRTSCELGQDWNRRMGNAARRLDGNIRKWSKFYDGVRFIPQLLGLGYILADMSNLFIYRTMATVSGRVFVYGGKGALGSVCVSHFKSKNWVSPIRLFYYFNYIGIIA